MSDKVCSDISYLTFSYIYYTDDNAIFSVLNPADHSRKNYIHMRHIKIIEHKSGMILKFAFIISNPQV
jgi:hypothetical protein